MTTQQSRSAVQSQSADQGAPTTILDRWIEWAKANGATVEIKIEARDGELDRARIWVWSRSRMAGLSVPVDTTPADLPALIEQKAREQIEGAAKVAEREQREGQRLLQWAAEQRETREAAAR